MAGGPGQRRGACWGIRSLQEFTQHSRLQLLENSLVSGVSAAATRLKYCVALRPAQYRAVWNIEHRQMAPGQWDQYSTMIKHYSTRSSPPSPSHDLY